MSKNYFENPRPRLVVVGNGMVGHRFVEAAAERGLLAKFETAVLSEESRLAYDRVNLSKWFEGKSDADLSLVSEGQYEALGVEVVRGDAAVELDRAARVVRLASGRALAYDELVLATGSYPFVPPIKGCNEPGCFVYRTIDDLVAIREAAQTATTRGGDRRRAAGSGGCQALLSLGLETHVLEFASRLMPLQVDDVGAAVLRARIEALGVQVRCNTTTREILLDERGHVSALLLGDGTRLPVDMVVFSAGIRPRDKLARESGLRLAERGGVQIDGCCRTSDERIFAIGECAAFDGKTYGLVAPGYRMAEVAAATIAGEAQGLRRLRHEHQAQADGRGRGQLRRCVRSDAWIARLHRLRRALGRVQEAGRLCR